MNKGHTDSRTDDKRDLSNDKNNIEIRNHRSEGCNGKHVYLPTDERSEESKCLQDGDSSNGEADKDGRLPCVKLILHTGHKFRTDMIFQEKIMYSIGLSYSFFMIGWNKGLFGPSYIDLRMISGTDIEQGSWILTSVFIGYTFGSIVQGCLYDRIDKKLLFAACLLVWSVDMAVIPWCSKFEAMLTGYLVIGVLQGILDSGGNAEILRIWDRKGRKAILMTNFVFSFGSVVAPLAVAPFLMQPFSSENLLNTTSLHGLLPNNNGTEEYSDLETNFSTPEIATVFESRLYIPFSIGSGLSLIATLLYFISYALYRNKRKQQTTKRDTSKHIRDVPRNIKLFTLAIIGFILFFYCAIDEAFTGFLSTYCYEYFNWSKLKGAFLTSLVFISILSSRVLSVLVERWINTLVYIGVHFILMFVSILGLLIFSVYGLDQSLWFFAPLYGFSKSCLFAMMFSWSNEYVTPMTGRISSFYMVCGTIGCSLNPILLGVLMEDEPIWYCYLFLIEMVMVLLLFVLSVFTTK